MIGDPEEFRAWVDSQTLFGRLVFIGMVILQVVVAVIPGEPMEIGAGYAFGAVEGSLLCLIGMALGSTLIFLFTKKTGRKNGGGFYLPGKTSIPEIPAKYGTAQPCYFLVFLIPGTPKDILTYFAGLTPIRLRTFLLLTSVARVPSIVSSTVGGNALGTQNYDFAVIVFLVTAVISAAGALIYKHHSQKKANERGRLRFVSC